MSDSKPYDGISELDQNRMATEPIRARSDEGLRDDQRRGDLPNTGGVHTGTKVVLEPLDDEQADAVGEEFYLELKEYDAERKPETEGWQETEDDPLPRDESSTGRD
jgi:hypothetical protein